jgi:phospholipase C
MIGRRNLIKALGGLAGSLATGGCIVEGDEHGSQEDELISCLWNGKGKQARKPRGVFGQIEHVVVLMMENRSFDHMFGALSIAKGMRDAAGNDFGGEGRADVNGLTGFESNVDLSGKKIGVFRQTEKYLGDIAHEWDECHRQYDFAGTGVGKNDGFVRAHQLDMQKGANSLCGAKYFDRQLCSKLNAPMGIYNRQDLPIYYALADNYTLCDRWHASVLGPTWPNRFYLHAGSSYGMKTNKPVLGKRSIWEVMRSKCLKVENYYCDLPWAHAVGEGVFALGVEVGDGDFGGVLQPFHASQKGWGSFYNAVKNDELGSFTLIDPGFSSGYDDHPPCDVGLGQAFVSYVYHILKSNPKVWNKTMFVITYDEHGSFYDHVVPPTNVAGSAHSYDTNPEFKRLGMRVPALVIGPWVKKGYVSHQEYEHTSILSSLYDRFDLASGKEGYLNARVQHANTLADCIATQQTAPRAAADIPKLAFSESEMMDFAKEKMPDGQEGLAKMVDKGIIPANQDLRPLRERHMADMLEIGEKVGAFQLSR